MKEPFDIRPDAQGESFLFHYTTALGLAAILDSGCLRFSSFERMNDPRERQPMNFSFIDPTQAVTLTPEQQSRLRGIVDDILRLGAFLACFTAEQTELSEDGYFARGWARPRSWAQYAGDHQGACLVFDREKLVQSTDDWLTAHPPRMASDIRHGRIEYEDRQSVDVHDGWLASMSATDEDGVRKIAEEWRKKYAPEFYFRKSTDWLSESEYRVLVWPSGRQQPFIPIVESLVGIILGSEFPSPEKSILGARLARIGVERIQIGYMDWYHGSPGTGRPELPGFDDIVNETVLYQAAFRPTGRM